MKIKFLGAIGEVTGSCTHCILRDGTQFLVDCGLFQSPESEDKNQSFDFDPHNIKYVLLTHAHADHCGRIPMLYQRGFKGEVVCTQATKELADMNMRTIAHHQPSLYTKDDVDQIKFSDKIQEHAGLWEISISDSASAVFAHSSHMLGATSIVISWNTNNDKKSICFSGDLGGNQGNNCYQPLLKGNHVPSEKIDYYVLESTYGSQEPKPAHIKNSVERMCKLEGIVCDPKFDLVIFPCFSMQRTQDILFDLFCMLRYHQGDRKTEYSIILDSEMSRRSCEIFKEHLVRTDKSGERVPSVYLNEEYFSQMTKNLCRHEIYSHNIIDDIFSLDHTNDNVSINFQHDPSICTDKKTVLLTSSGMCNAGKIIGHLSKLKHPSTAIVLTGYQGSHNGKLLQEIARNQSRRNCHQALIYRDLSQVHASGMHGLNDKYLKDIENDNLLHACEIKGKVVDLGIYYSGHADVDGLLDFLDTPLRQSNNVTLFLNHGDNVARENFQKKILRKSKNTSQVRTIKPGWFLKCFYDLNKNAFDFPSLVAEKAQLRGTVRVIREDSALVEIAPDICGFMDIADISWKHVGPISETLSVGQEVKVMVLEMDKEKGRISLGMKQLQPIDFPSIISEGARLRGTVRSITEYGALVEITPDICGLMHIANISWKHAASIFEMLSVGQEVEVMVLEVDKEKGRISLGMKQLRPIDFPSIVVEKARLHGTVQAIVEYGAFVEIAPNICGLIHIADISWKHIASVSDILSVGQEVEVMVLAVNKKKGHISLGMKQLQPMDFSNIVTEGARLLGTVQELVEYGAFVEIAPNICGLIHIADISWKRTASIFETLTVGQEVEVMVLAVDKEKWRISLGMKQLQPNPREHFVHTHPVGSRIFGKVTRVMEYGVFVEVEDGIEGLVRITDISWKHITSIPKTLFVGKEVEVMILGAKKHKRYISLGMKQLQPNPWEDFDRTHPVGSRMFGKVTQLMEYGVFVEVEDGIEGLVRITDISWKHITSIPKTLFVGKEVEVMVLRIHKEKGCISLGMKQLQPYPWEYFNRIPPAGSRMFGKVTRAMEYGVFVEVEDGVQGLVHSSEMSWTRKNINPLKSYSPGDEVEVMILEIDAERRRISLGIKQCTPNPWQDFAAAHRKGDRLTAKVRSVSTEFGLFMELDGGIDGLVRLTELSYDEPGETALRKYKKGDEAEVVVLSIDAERERIGLGIKQLESGGFDEFVEQHLHSTQGVRGKITAIVEKGAQVELEGGVRGFLPIGEIAEQRVENISDFLKEGEEHEFILIKSDARNMQAVLSIKEMIRQQREQAAGVKKGGATMKAEDHSLSRSTGRGGL